MDGLPFKLYGQDLYEYNPELNRLDPGNLSKFVNCEVFSR